MLATAEKGYIDVSVTVDTVGGHSSVPPDHTASKFDHYQYLGSRYNGLIVGYLAQIITTIERNQFESQLTSKNPTSEYLKLAALFSKDMPAELRESILDSTKIDKVIEYMNSSPQTRTLIRTSTAVDVVRGGEKGTLGCTVSNISYSLRPQQMPYQRPLIYW